MNQIEGVGRVGNPFHSVKQGDNKMRLNDLFNVKLENKKVYTATKKYSQRTNFGKNSCKSDTYTDIICFNLSGKYCIVVVNEFSSNPTVKQFDTSDSANRYFKAIVKNSGQKFERRI